MRRTTRGELLLSQSTAAAVCVVIFNQLRGTPEQFSIWCQHWEEMRQDSLANGTLRRLGLCHSVPARRIQSHPISLGSCSTAIDLRLASSTPAVMAQATGAVRVLRHASLRLAPPVPAHTYAQYCPTAPATPALTLIPRWRTKQHFVVALWEHRQKLPTSPMKGERKGLNSSQSHGEGHPHSQIQPLWERQLRTKWWKEEIQIRLVGPLNKRNPWTLKDVRGAERNVVDGLPFNFATGAYVLLRIN